MIQRYEEEKKITKKIDNLFNEERINKCKECDVYRENYKHKFGSNPEQNVNCCYYYCSAVASDDYVTDIERNDQSEIYGEEMFDIPREKMNEFAKEFGWDDELGFYDPDDGCRLPRDKMPLVCLNFNCEGQDLSDEELGKLEGLILELNDVRKELYHGEG